MGAHEDAVARAAELAAVGLGPAPSAATEARLVDAVSLDPDPRARAAAIGALARVGTSVRASDAWGRAADDPEPEVRRRAAEVAPTLAGNGQAARLIAPLVRLLGDEDVTVVEAAAWALGELGDAAIAGGAVDSLADVALGHDDMLGREAAVGALGALGDEAGLPAILAGCRDKPTIRRRAVLALAPFEGDEVEAALGEARADRDWQVRQAAEDLTRAAAPGRQEEPGPQLPP
jgi:HEAT repeat protein